MPLDLNSEKEEENPSQEEIDKVVKEKGYKYNEKDYVNLVEQKPSTEELLKEPKIREKIIQTIIKSKEKKEVKKNPKQIPINEGPYFPIQEKKQVESKYPPKKNLFSDKIKKRLLIVVGIFVVIVVFIILLNLFYFTSAFSDKDFSPNLNIENNPAQVNLTNKFEHEILNNITNIFNLNIDDDIIEDISERILEKLNIS